MADAAVGFLLENLKQLLIHRTKLIKGVKEQVQQLQTDVEFFQSFLKQVPTKKQRKNEIVKALVREIRSVVYDAGDIIDAFVTQAAESKSRSCFSRVLLNSPRLVNIAEQAETICRRIKENYGREEIMNIINLAPDGDKEQPVPPTQSRKTNVVGFKHDFKKIKERIDEETEHLDVISVVGIPGLGMTTLPGKVFHDPDIICQFPIRVWVNISQEFTENEVFRTMLRRMKTGYDENKYGKMDATQLAKDIATTLSGGKFLIVMDDVWMPNDWDKLKVALPEQNAMGKVSITTRNSDVGKHVNRYRDPHGLPLLTLEESCELLQWEVFNKPEFPPDLESVGKDIAGNCGGLPLAIVVIGGILVTKVSTTASAWEKVSKSVTTFLELNPHKRMERIIAMSYEKLPYHLKECFLYLGMFPEDFEIPTWELIRMWIAEGLIKRKDGFSMEESAEYYLNDLINRNLVGVDKFKRDGRVKTCRIHDMIRDFCKTEGGKDGENFFQEIKQFSDGGLEPAVTEGEKHRRLSIHSNVMDFLSRKPKGPYVRSFVTFCEKVEVSIENSSAIPAAFKLLRVLEAKPLEFCKTPTRDLYQLFHLKYLAISFQFNRKGTTIPKALTKLWNLETFIVHSYGLIALDIRADIMSLPQLRHIKTIISITLAKPAKDSKEGEKLQTLTRISPKSCTEKIFARARNLKKLGICGEIVPFLDGKLGSFESLKNLSNLETLKLENDLLNSRCILKCLPPSYKFPRNLKSITLDATRLDDWCPMSVLGSLKKLQILKVKQNAVKGPRWVVDDRGFDSLEVLHIESVDLSTWVASSRHFPNLKQLKLRKCWALKEIPIGLADIMKFEYLDLYDCARAAASARKIKEKKNVGTFKLSIQE